MANVYYAFQQQKINLKYKNKSKRIKKIMKNMVFENAALCDQVAQIQENILCVKEERRFLFKKLIEHDSELLIESKPTNQTILHQLSGSQDSSSGANHTVKKPSKKRSNSEASNKSKSSNNSKLAKSTSAAFSQKKQIVQTISVDLKGRPICPINMGNLTIHDLGEIVYDRPGYHTENWIYPPGFISTRIYGHIKEPDRKCVYTCKIVDAGDFPNFEIIPDNDMEYAIAGPSADLCHAALLQIINSYSDARHIEVRPQGEWFFGLGHPTIMTLIQTSPNAKKCSNFIAYNVDSFSMEKENDPTVNYDALQKHIAISAYHTVPEIKEEPPDELLEQSDGTSCSYSLP